MFPMVDLITDELEETKQKVWDSKQTKQVSFHS